MIYEGLSSQSRQVNDANGDVLFINGTFYLCLAIYLPVYLSACLYCYLPI